MGDTRGSHRNRPYAPVSVTHDVQDEIRDLAVVISTALGKRTSQSDSLRIVIKLFQTCPPGVNREERDTIIRDYAQQLRECGLIK